MPTGEKRISAKEAGALLTPRRPVATIYNWMYIGFSGVTLEFERQVGLVFTSAEALERFIDKTGQ